MLLYLKVIYENLKKSIIYKHYKLNKSLTSLQIQVRSISIIRSCVNIFKEHYSSITKRITYIYIQDIKMLRLRIHLSNDCFH